MRRITLLPFVLAFATAAPPAWTKPHRVAAAVSGPSADCPQFYLGAQPPATVGPPARPGDRTLCHSFYVISYSTSLRDPVWTSYRLTRAMAEGGDRIGRYQGLFRPEPGLAKSEEGAHRDYVHPPYDRGHLTPANDAVDMTTQSDTFMITNVVPQVSELNQRLWRFLEASVHELAEDDGEVYIVTGARFAASPPLMHRAGQPGRIAVPDATFKAIYDPSRNIAVGYLATNEVATVCTVMSIAELARETGINPFPSLPAAVTDHRPDFVLPKGKGTDAPDCRPAANDR
jgi:endonuclease G, mitochondrial